MDDEVRLLSVVSCLLLMQLLPQFLTPGTLALLLPLRAARLTSHVVILLASSLPSSRLSGCQSIPSLAFFAICAAQVASCCAGEPARDLYRSSSLQTVSGVRANDLRS